MHTKTKRIVFLFIILAALLLLTTGLALGKDNPLSLLATQSPVTTGFTYQGQLTEGSAPADGVFDLQFELYDAETDGALLGTVAVEDVVVADGLFTVLLDFGAGVFDGQARWLAIGVRAGAETGAYTPLTPRQALTAAPYAQYALEAGSVAWEDVGDNPLPDNCTADQLVTWNETLSVWECVANTDTTYNAGFGLELDGNTFTVLTDTLQTRVTDGCAEGSTIRVITANGNVECETHDTRPVFSRTTIEIVGEKGIGSHNSITIGADGLPVISHYDDINHDLKVTHCNDPACISATTTTVDTTGDVGWDNSIIIGADGLPVISYYDGNNTRLKVARCHNATCSSATTIIMGSAGDKGTSITIGTDGLPVISYYDYGDLMVAHCNDADCTNETTMPVDTSGDVGWYNSITIGVDGLPVISYYDRDNRGLKVAHCNDIACTSATSSTVDPAVVDIVFDTSITIGADGLPVISYYVDEFAFDERRIKVAHCNDASCTNATTTVVDTTEKNENDIYTTSITIGADGLPVLSYFDGTNYDLKVAHCNDAVCTSATTTIVDTTGSVGRYNAITIGDDGLPMISYYDDTTGALKVTHCSNPFCVPYFRRR